MASSVSADECRLEESVYGRVVYCSDGCYNENVDRSASAVDRNEKVVKLIQQDVPDVTWSSRLLQEVRSLPRKALRVADWAGERLAGMVGITDSKFDVHLWQREYETQKQDEEEVNIFIIDPSPPKSNVLFPLEVRKSAANSQGRSYVVMVGAGVRKESAEDAAQKKRGAV